MRRNLLQKANKGKNLRVTLSVTQRADGDNIGSIVESAEDWLKGRLEFAWKLLCCTTATIQARYSSETYISPKAYFWRVIHVPFGTCHRKDQHTRAAIIKQLLATSGREAPCGRPCSSGTVHAACSVARLGGWGEPVSILLAR